VRHKKVLSIVFIGLQMIHETKIHLLSDDIAAAWQQLNVLQQRQWWD